MKFIFLLFLLVCISERLKAQDGITKIPIHYETETKVISQNQRTYMYFQASSPYLQISCTGLNHLELREGSEWGNAIPFYEKNRSSQNVDFLFENLSVGQTYFIVLQNSFFEKNQAEISLIEMNQKLVMNRTAKNVRPFQNVKVIEYKNPKLQKN